MTQNQIETKEVREILIWGFIYLLVICAGVVVVCGTVALVVTTLRSLVGQN